MITEKRRDKEGVLGITYTTTTLILYPDSSYFLTLKKTLENMGMTSKNYVIMEHKTIPKQIPLFEEQDDGNLIPYVKET
jgi:hypothetical protein